MSHDAAEEEEEPYKFRLAEEEAGRCKFQLAGAEEVGSIPMKQTAGMVRPETVHRTAAADALTAVGRPSRDGEELAIAVVEGQACVGGSYKDTAGCMDSS